MLWDKQSKRHMKAPMGSLQSVIEGNTWKAKSRTGNHWVVLNAANEAQEDLLRKPHFQQVAGDTCIAWDMFMIADDKAARSNSLRQLVHSRPARCVKDLGLGHRVIG